MILTPSVSSHQSILHLNANKLNLHVLIVHIIMPGRFLGSRVLFSRSDDFRIGFHLLIKGRQRRSDKSFDKHSDQDALGRPIGEGPVNFMWMLYQSLLLISLIFFKHALLYRERQGS